MQHDSASNTLTEVVTVAGQRRVHAEVCAFVQLVCIHVYVFDSD